MFEYTPEDIANIMFQKTGRKTANIPVSLLSPYPSLNILSLCKQNLAKIFSEKADPKKLFTHPENDISLDRAIRELYACGFDKARIDHFRTTLQESVINALRFRATYKINGYDSESEFDKKYTFTISSNSYLGFAFPYADENDTDELNDLLAKEYLAFIKKIEELLQKYPDCLKVQEKPKGVNEEPFL